ncbi:MAG TPA: class I SAM-dependent methyltransferase [Acidimicrobiales bacterium]|nr:class I SAM-dependent methyltransferase [Acidimicrobiales bacterium]
MSPVEVFLCRNPLWCAVAGKVVLPWSLQGYEPLGEVLEIGAGSGAMAAELLARSGTIAMTVTDFDPGMVAAATARLARFGDRATARQADATALPFPDWSFDAVLSWIMLHHTVEWEKALAESVRVLRPGGHVVAYDLLSTGPTRRLHRGRSTHRTLRLGELRAVVAELPVDQAVITPGLGGLVVRFLLRKQPSPSGPAFPSEIRRTRAGRRHRLPL